MSCIPRMDSLYANPAVFHVIFPSSESLPKVPIRVTFTFSVFHEHLLIFEVSRNNSVFMVISFLRLYFSSKAYPWLKNKITVQVGYLYSSHKGNYEMKCTDVQKSVLQLKQCSPGTALDQWHPCPDHIFLVDARPLVTSPFSLSEPQVGVFHMDIIWWKCHISWCWNKSFSIIASERHSQLCLCSSLSHSFKARSEKQQACESREGEDICLPRLRLICYLDKEAKYPACSLMLH